jgi:hypothetical protein
MTNSITIKDWQEEARISQHKLELIKSVAYIKIRSLASYLYEIFPDLEPHYKGLFSDEYLHPYLNQISLQMMLEQGVDLLHDVKVTAPPSSIDEIGVNWGADYVACRLSEPFLEAFNQEFVNDYHKIFVEFFGGDLSEEDESFLKANYQYDNLIDAYFGIPDCQCCEDGCSNPDNCEHSSDENSLPKHYKELRDSNPEGEI